jgi:hypothetical protein
LNRNKNPHSSNKNPCTVPTKMEKIHSKKKNKEKENKQNENKIK